MTKKFNIQPSPDTDPLIIEMAEKVLDIMENTILSKSLRFGEGTIPVQVTKGGNLLFPTGKVFIMGSLFEIPLLHIKLEVIIKTYLNALDKTIKTISLPDLGVELADTIYNAKDYFSEVPSHIKDKELRNALQKDFDLVIWLSSPTIF